MTLDPFQVPPNVPEPTSLCLIGLGSLVMLRRRH
ncbi:MAG: PEP-CTERM sorting domain-containing protein [Phycisphaeraceae bacterium]|nr:PEP-CTERM sorting domain-containing protein [Phycisphaeraceae bacterium]